MSYFKIKASVLQENEKYKIETYLTDALNWVDAGKKIHELLGADDEIEDICLMKQYKPAINEIYDEDNNKLYLVKIAEDMIVDDQVKTVKYVMPAFANNSNDLYKIVNDYISQGLENMRLTTISETKWKFI